MVVRAAAEGLDPGPELDVGERLGEVVVPLQARTR
jgi:hypothetical protein